MPITNNMHEKQAYTPAAHCSLLDEEKVADLTQHQPLVDLWEPEGEYPRPSFSAQSFQQVLIFALFCSNVFFAALAMFFYTNAQCPVVPQRLDPFSISAASRDARAHIRYEQRTFTGNLKFNSTTGSLFRSSSINTTEPQFVGNPRETPGLDRAWKHLLSGSKFPLSDEEVTPYLQTGLVGSSNAAAEKHPSSSTSTTLPTVYAELDVFHSLSCLNAIRVALDDDFYREHGPQDGLGWQRTTRADREQLGEFAMAPRPPLQEIYSELTGYATDYCIDHLRQSLQCSADLSVMPMLPRTSGVEFAAPSRTCRRWDDVRSWVDRRQERSRFSSGGASSGGSHQLQQQYTSV
ncbi:hypothetical protein B0J12DRAFT_658599 [Macrophomina phaseolina]|uniref:Tat pathway signal sequence n=1 Tax=Macrophomina phaseolina TaxID=35725 RepID=A0ABQ8GDL6_9PEZI|nr:hypothetical protein B0J12DRAFT_658599 [Macrophomina phaseolina]